MIKGTENNALHAMSTEDLSMCSSSTSSSGIEENDKNEKMECCQLLDQKSQGTVEIQSNGAIPVNYGESLNVESVEKIIFPCTNPIEEAMRAINIASTDCTPSGYTELLYSSNSPNRVQNEDCQNMDGDVTNIQHLVPSSPQNWDGFNDPLPPVWYCDSLDTDKPLQQDNDPFLSEIALDCLKDSLIDESENLMADHEARPFMSSLILRI